MIFNWKESRAARKFFRSRLSIAALVVILIYFSVAIYVGVLQYGGVSRENPDGSVTTVPFSEVVDGRIGTKNIPGFFIAQSPEKRLESCEFMLRMVDRAPKKSDPAEALKQIDFGRLKPADLPPDDLAVLIDRGWKLDDVLAPTPNLNEAPDLLPQLEQLEQVVADLFPPPSGWDGFLYSFELSLGTARQGRSIMMRAIYSIMVAMEVGLVTAVISVFIGALLGTAAGYFGGWVDHAVIWLYSTFASIPNLVLLILLAYMFTGATINEFTWMGIKFPTMDLENTLIPVFVAFGLTFWIGPCRVIRGETLKIKELEYVQAAKVMGCSRFYIMLRHIIPNTAHLLLINFSLLFIAAIKSEVILSFLGLGVKGQPSWGIMISQSSQEVINSFFWQIGTATVFMFGLVLAFNIVSDALQDAFDPKHQ